MVNNINKSRTLCIIGLLGTLLIGCGGQDEFGDETAPPDELVTPPVVPTNPINPTDPTDPNNPVKTDWDEGSWDNIKWS
jgi:PBP1b-binding outer membrane lipoprotein LpoB